MYKLMFRHMVVSGITYPVYRAFLTLDIFITYIHVRRT